MLEGWQVNSIVSLFGAQPWGVIDTGTDLSLTGEGVDRWNFTGSPSDFKATKSTGVPWIANTDFVTDAGGNVTGVLRAHLQRPRLALPRQAVKPPQTSSLTGVVTQRASR